MATGTTALTGHNAEDEATINSLLSDDAPSSEEKPSTESEHKPGPTTEEDKPDTATGEEEEQPDKTDETSEEEEETEKSDEAEEEEGELSIEDSDRDYSPAAYEKAAAHFSKTLGVQLNPEDPAHRALLKENMDRGEALKRLTAESKAKEAAKTDEVKVDETKTAAEPTPVQATPEQIKAGLESIENVAKARLNPQVAMYNANRIMKAFWPDEKIELSQERANDISTAFHTLFLEALDDALPFLHKSIGATLEADPVWGPARTQAIKESAFEHIEKTKGAEYASNLAALAESGALQKVIDDNPDLFKNIRAGNGKDPILNKAAQFDAAFKIARGDQTIKQVTAAVETGKKQATDRAKNIAAGRVGAGTPKSGLKPGQTESTELVKNLTGGGGSKFGAAVKAQLHR